MSDPVTNVDIEDVLASIRRLVLQGPPAPASASASAAPPARSRLVLTQALRVEEPDAPGAEGHDSDGDGDSPLGAATEEDGMAVGTDAPAEAREGRPGPSEGSVLVLSAPMAVPTRATDLRGIEAALSDAPDAWEPDGSEEMDWSLGSVAEAAPTPVFRHRAAVPPGGEAAPASASSPASAATSAPAPALDDARLRALITEVLRAELQGEMGERMTRNIRKLVRREIFRVLETRDDG